MQWSILKVCALLLYRSHEDCLQNFQIYCEQRISTAQNSGSNNSTAHEKLDVSFLQISYKISVQLSSSCFLVHPIHALPSRSPKSWHYRNIHHYSVEFDSNSISYPTYLLNNWMKCSLLSNFLGGQTLTLQIELDDSFAYDWWDLYLIFFEVVWYPSFMFHTSCTPCVPKRFKSTPCCMEYLISNFWIVLDWLLSSQA